MSNKLISYFLLSTILVATSGKSDAVQVIYTQPIYAYHDTSAACAGAIAGAACGLGLIALMAADYYTFDHTCWLYFSNDVLVQWGRPNDWQRAPDNIQEVRYR